AAVQSQSLTNSALPFVRDGSKERILRASGFKSAKRFDWARKTETATPNLLRFCWKDRFRSTVMKTSNSFSARAQKLAILYRRPSHLRHGVNKMPSQSFCEPPVNALIQKKLHFTPPA